MLFFSSVMTVVEHLAPAGARGWYTGIWAASTMGLSALIAPLISSAALDADGPEPMWTTSFALGVPAASGLLSLKRHIDNTPTEPGPVDVDLIPTRASPCCPARACAP